jgi:CRP-like cAMP-binding protein
VSVHSKGQELAKLGEGACFGEMSLFDAEPRSASITTLESCDCLMLTQQQLYEAIDETPGIAINIIRLLSRRIRELNQDLNEHQGRIKELTRKLGGGHPAEPLRSQSVTGGQSPRETIPYPVPERPSTSQRDGNGSFPYSGFPQ